MLLSAPRVHARPQQLCVARSGADGVSDAQPITEDEIVFYEGSGSNAELALSILMGATILYLVSNKDSMWSEQCGLLAY